MDACEGMEGMSEGAEGISTGMEGMECIELMSHIRLAVGCARIPVSGGRDVILVFSVPRCDFLYARAPGFPPRRSDLDVIDRLTGFSTHPRRRASPRDLHRR